MAGPRHAALRAEVFFAAALARLAGFFRPEASARLSRSTAARSMTLVACLGFVSFSGRDFPPREIFFLISFLKAER